MVSTSFISDCSGPNAEHASTAVNGQHEELSCNEVGKGMESMVMGEE